MEKPRKNRGSLVTFFSSAVFLLVLVVVMFSTGSLAGGANEEGVAATRAAIERAAVLCYASEGFYPPNLAYIEEYYGVQIDRARYLVRYDIFASNIQPSVDVIPL